MAKELKAEAACSPTTGRGSMTLFLTLASVFGLIALWPFVPPFEILTMEESQVLRVWKSGFASTTTNLKTTSGRDVRCVHGRTGGCSPVIMISLLENRTPVMVWHDGEKVYQLTARDKVILPYDHFHQGRWFAGGVSIISLLIALIQFSISKGLLGVASTKSPRP